VLIRENLRIEGVARIDGRAGEALTDEELILNAYETWGEDCVNHLIGDFAFAIWDERKQKLFCARDHFGVKPFFYTHIDGSFRFSSTLNDLRRNPHVSNTLNEIAIGDYLAFGINQDLSTTIFKDIQRLAPGHTLIVANNEIKIRRYWTASLPSREIRFSDDESYVSRFSELFSQAVKDRLRTDRVAISMSGGLDSTSLAAVAQEHSSVAAFTVVYDKLIPDEERHYSDLAAKHLGIPITHLSADRYSLFDGNMKQAEPFLLSPLTGQFNDLLRLCADYSPVALTGYDGDSFMNEPQPTGFGIRRRLRRIFTKPSSIPEWIDESFAKRTNIHERWKQGWSHTFQ
jgi:asparagine synthase (glutamine-hydrolysing)